MGVKTEGGFVDFITREVEVECLPKIIPEHIEIDISGLHLRESLKAEDITLPEGVKLITSSDTILVLIEVPLKEEEIEVEEEEEMISEEEEPEVIGKEKLEKEKEEKEEKEEKGGKEAKEEKRGKEARETREEKRGREAKEAREEKREREEKQAKEKE